MRAMSFRKFQRYYRKRNALTGCEHVENDRGRTIAFAGNFIEYFVCTARACPVWGKCKEVKARGK